MAKRIQSEIRDMCSNRDPNISAMPFKNNIFHWKAVIKGPEGTPYHGGAYKLDITLPADYPFKPPKIKFITSIYHCNINGRGDICIDTLKDGWSPAMTIEKTLLTLIGLLENPNPDDPLVPSIALEMRERSAIFLEKARKMTVANALDNNAGINVGEDSNGTETEYSDE